MFLHVFSDYSILVFAYKCQIVRNLKIINYLLKGLEIAQFRRIFHFFLQLKNSNSNGIEFSSILDKISVKFSISASFFFGHCFFHL